MDLVIRRALLSVSDKEGLVDFAAALAEHGVELIASGGTRAAMEAAGLAVTDVTTVSGSPEAFQGRMKTLSFPIVSALLFDRERDRDEAARLGIRPIDLVVCNLYPFAGQARAGAPPEVLVEHIDIGGPTLIRAAAKNARHVAVATSPGQYAALARELRQRGGALSLETRARLMREAFDHTADYDAIVATTLRERAGESSVRLHFGAARPLRYGENPHQRAEFLRDLDAPSSLHDARVLGGRGISYNNLLDLDAAVRAVVGLERQGCAVVKHGNPVGLAEAEVQADALRLAWASDPVSAYGSVIAFNRRLTEEAVRFLRLDHPTPRERRFVEVVAAPGFDEAAVRALGANRNLRTVEFDEGCRLAAAEWRFLPGALLRQEPDADAELLTGLEVVTSTAPPPLPEPLLRFALRAVRELKSNAIAIVRATPDGSFQLIGAGAGQPNRVTSVRLALERATATVLEGYEGPPERRAAFLSEALGRAVLASDAFFPFADSIDLCRDAGLRVVLQPGGSIRDAEVIARCDASGIAMIMTGRRHFRH